jgi:DNA-binding NtrC family response regulator/serine/threonine protein kinase/tetratricopeptide (TPR) repeat protein
MGRVWLAEDQLLDRSLLALKAYPPATPAGLLRREFQTLRELRHPGIARAFHFGTAESDGAPFFTMEYIAGAPLDRHLERLRDRRPEDAGRPVLLSALDLFIQAAAAAGHLHRRGLLHLDLKPANILVQDPGREAAAAGPGRRGRKRGTADGQPLVVLIDFGLIRTLGAADGGPRRGTAPFMAPEIFAGEEVDARADVYALGVTFYRALTGRYPLEAGDVEGWARAHRSATPAPAPELPAGLERLLLCALAKSPARRFADATALERALLAARSELRPRTEPWRPPPVEPELTGRERELARFEEWKERSRAARPLLLVSGPDGIGKSRLLEAIETRLLMSGAAALWAGGEAEDAAPLIAETVRRAALIGPEERGSRDGLGDRILDHRAGLSPPDAETRRIIAATAPGEVRQIARRVAVKRLAGLLARQPVFLLVDSLSEADPEGREFVIELAAALTRGERAGARPAAPLRGGIIAAITSDPQATGPIRALLRSHRAGAAWLPIAGLSARASRRFIEAAGGSLAGRAVPFAEIHRRTAGNPLYLLEEARALSEHGKPVPRGRDLSERLRRRLADLAPRKRGLALLLALAARPLTIRVLARAAGCAEDEALQAAREMAIAGLLTGGAGRALRFSHRSIGDIAAGLAPEAEIAALHRALATALRADGAPPADVAHHLFEAGEDEKAIAILEDLARRPQGAELESPRALLALERAARSRGGCASERGRALLEALGDRLDQAGQFEAARRRREELADAGGIAGEERARHLRKLAALCHRMGDPAEAERRLTKALEILGIGAPGAAPAPARRPGRAAGAVAAPAITDPSGERLAALAEMALLFHFKNDPRAEDCARMGIDLFSRLPEAGRGGRSGLLTQRAIDLHGVAGQIAIRKLALDEAIAFLSAGHRLARAAGEPVNSALLLNNLGLAFHMESRFREAIDAFRKARRIASSLGDSAALFAIACNLAQIHAKLGRFTRALEELDRLRVEPGAAQSERLRLNLLYTRALVLSLLGDPAAGWDEVLRLAARLGDRFLHGFAAVYKAEALMARGSFSEARSVLARAGGPAAGRILASRMARIEAALGHTRRAEARVAAYGKCRERLPELVDAWNRLHLGQAHLDLAHLDAAEAELSAAEKFFRDRRVAPGQIEAALLLADLHLRRAGSAGDQAGAAVSAARADLERARRVEVEAPGGVSPRLRALRGDLLAARIELRQRLSGHGERAPGTRIRDHLASAGGEAHLRKCPPLLVQYEALTAAAARLRGDLDAEKAAAERLALARAGLARRLTRGDRRASAGERVLDRLGLPELEAGPRSPGWPRWAAGALAGALRAISRKGATDPPGREAALQEALGCLARPLAAPAASLVAIGKSGARLLACATVSPEAALEVAAGWRPPPVPALRREGGAAVLSCPITVGGKPAGALLVRLGADPARTRAAEIGLSLKVLAAFADLFSATGVLGERSGSRGGERREPRAERADDDATRTRTIELADRPSSVGLFGKSPAMVKLARLIEAAGATELPVLITGESGTGKEVVARAIHRTGRRAHGPFISQNCAAIPGGLLEADLFGYARGAFTGAEKTKSGYILKAQGGTFLLDEIGDADLATQAKILRVLEEKSFRPVGGRSEVPVDVRFIAVTQRDIDSLVRAGSFRSDLFYRLAGLRIHVPALRERVEDIEVLLARFLERILDRRVRIAPQALALLAAHSWPGNVRELTTVAQRLALGLAGGARMVPASLVAEVLDVVQPSAGAGTLSPAAILDRPYSEARRAFEHQSLRSLWTRHHGSLERMAAELGTTVRSIYRMFEKLGLKPKDFRQNQCGKSEPC